MSRSTISADVPAEKTILDDHPPLGGQLRHRRLDVLVARVEPLLQHRPRHNPDAFGSFLKGAMAP